MIAAEVPDVDERPVLGTAAAVFTCCAIRRGHSTRTAADKEHHNDASLGTS